MYLCNSCMVVFVGLLKMYLCKRPWAWPASSKVWAAATLLQCLSSRPRKQSWSKMQLCAAVKPGIYGLAFSMEKCFLTDNSAKVGRILMISSAHPHRILILIKWGKNQPSSKSASACVLKWHYAYNRLRPILAYFCLKVLRFFWGQIFNFVGINMGNIWAERSL